MALVASLALLAGCGSDGETAGSTQAGPRPQETIDLAASGAAPTGAGGTATTDTAPQPDPPPPAAPKPRIVQKPIPFGSRRKSQMRAYAKRHYGTSTYQLVDPKVIVEHVTVTSTFSAVYNTFASNAPDVELHELPGVCSHFVVDRDGTIYQLVPLGIMCRHTVGLNYTAIGIEHVGQNDAQVLGNSRQLRASLKLTKWLRCRYGVKTKDVIGHAESLSSPYHMERVARLRNQTHGDMARGSMKTYRHKLGRPAC